MTHIATTSWSKLRIHVLSKSMKKNRAKIANGFPQVAIYLGKLDLPHALTQKPRNNVFFHFGTPALNFSTKLPGDTLMTLI